MQGGQYTQHVGQKFYADGSVRAFPGNTILCFVDIERHTAVYERTLSVQAELLAMPWHAKFTLLPPSSFHMTVMDLLVDEVRTPARWSSKIPLSATLEETDTFFLATVPTVPVPERFRMRYTGIRKPAMIELEPADQETEVGDMGVSQSDSRGDRGPSPHTRPIQISYLNRLSDRPSDGRGRG